MMAVVAILVEGQTEETFVKDVLNPYFVSSEVYFKVTIIDPKRGSGIKHQKGGVSNYESIQKDLHKLLNKPHFTLVTTTLDFYALPKDFPKPDRIDPNVSCYERVALFETAFAADIQHARFLPYLALHEFEGMLFSAPEKIAQQFPDGEKQAKALTAIRQAFDSPEEINDSYETTPSRRIRKLFPDYQKVVHGTDISKSIGLECIRSECPHFDQWLQKLEMHSERH